MPLGNEFRPYIFRKNKDVIRPKMLCGDPDFGVIKRYATIRGGDELQLFGFR
jgi:hypothetical protein